MMKSSEIDELLASLASLAKWRQVAFMALCCERMLPNFERFSEETGYGDSRQLRKGLDAIWGFVVDKEPRLHASALIDSCDAQAPNTGEHSSLFTSPALDAANAISTTLEATVRFETEHARVVIELATDTIDLYVQATDLVDPFAPSGETAILEHPLMRREFDVMQRSLKFIREMPDDRKEAARLLLDRQAGFTEASLPG